MTDVIIRKAEREDLPSVLRLWRTVFGDEEAYIRSFLEALQDCGYAAIALQGSEAVSMTVVIRDLFLEDTPCSYLYAVATREEFRGCGLASRILHFCVEEEQRRGALIITAPAEPGLFHWYETSIGAKYILECRHETAKADDSAPLPVKKLEVCDYLAHRETILQDKPHLVAGEHYLRLVDILCSSYGGGLFLIGSSLAAVYPDEGNLHCQELLLSQDHEAQIISSLLRHFNSQTADYRLPGGGTRYLASRDPLPSGEWFGLLLD